VGSNPAIPTIFPKLSFTGPDKDIYNITRQFGCRGAMNCFTCETPITVANDSREHIILRAIGGRRTTSGFFCSSCNSAYGQGPDAEAARQLNHWSLFFGIERQGNDPPSTRVKTVGGGELILNPGGRLSAVKPEIVSQKIGDTTQYSVKARSHGEARQVLEGLKRKHPQLDIEAEMAKTQSVWSVPEGPIMFQHAFGGDGAHRSAIKAAAAFAHESGVDHALFNIARAYLKGAPVDPPIGFYQERDLVQGRPAGIPIHCVAVRADPKTGLILGYVEYFGFQRCVVGLGENYSGPLQVAAYAINPLTSQEVPVTVDLSFDKTDLRAIYTYERIAADKAQASLAAVIPTGLARQAEAEHARRMNEAVEYAYSNCGAKEGEMLTEEHIRNLSHLFVERMAPYIASRIPRFVPPGISDEENF